MTEHEQDQATAQPAAEAPVEKTAGAETPDFGSTAPESRGKGAAVNPAKTDIDMLRDVELNVTAELGRTRLTLGEITNLAAGSVVTLAKAAGEPADLRINDQLFASGEVIVIDGYFAVKITKLLSKEERMKSFT